MFRLSLCSIAIVSLCLSGCGSSEFGTDSIKGILEGSPVNLSDEQVTLTPTQLDCGVQNELWDPPSGNIAHLTQKGRDLKFSDDVRVTDPDIHLPFTQVNGTFPVSVSDVSKLRDTDGGMKLADVKLGVVITHDCFTSPLPLMGIKKGKFAPDAPVVFRFQGSGKEWTLDKLVH
ncbi:MAG: hypothetical protein ABSF22_02460 [Bryobacteraceae bacterium]|jgi:hypothetical protein